MADGEYGKHCFCCDEFVTETNHIALDEVKEIIVLCDNCYHELSKFFN